MNEMNLYRKLYSMVVGGADDILQELAVTLTNPDCGRKELMEFGEKLKKVLQDAEEMFISSSGFSKMDVIEDFESITCIMN